MMGDSTLTITILALAVIAVTITFVTPHLRSRRERGLTALYEETCTSRRYLGFGVYGGLVTARFSFYEEFMVVASLWPRLLPYQEIESVEQRPMFVVMGVVIRRRNARMRIALFPKQANTVFRILAGKGIALITPPAGYAARI